MLLDWALYSAALALAAALVPGFKVEGGLKGTLVVAALFGLLNWALSWLLGLVLAVLTLGISLLLGVITHTLVTAVVLQLTAGVTDRLKIKSFGAAFISALLMSITVALLKKLV
jgi:putative membrane protein